MPSHAYFYAAADNPFLEHEGDEALIDSPDQIVVRERILDALHDAFGQARTYDHSEHAYSNTYVGDLEVLVTSRYVHVRLPWYSPEECDEYEVVRTLRRFERALRDAVGFDAFEHGCQGLHVPGDIDLVPTFLGGMRGRIDDVFASASTARPKI